MSVVLISSFSPLSAPEILLHVSGANTSDPEDFGAIAMLHDMNEAYESCFAHFAQMLLFFQFLDVDTPPTLVWNAALRPLAGRCCFPPFF